MVYHDREESEQEGLRELILASVHTDKRRREVEAMFRSGAEALREEGATRALQDGILDLVRKKFGRVPRAAERAIRATHDRNRLQDLLVRAGTATALQEVGIAAPSQ